MKQEIEKNTKTGLDAIIKCAEANVEVKIWEAKQELLAEVKEKVGNLAVILYDEAQSPTDTPKIGHAVDLQQVLDILTKLGSDLSKEENKDGE